jgi:hypothetical protein
MPKRTGDHKALQFSRRRRETQEALAKLHQFQTMVLQISHDLTRKSPVVADLPDVELPARSRISRSIKAKSMALPGVAARNPWSRHTS